MIEIRKATIKDLKDIQELSLLLFKKEHKQWDKLLDLNWTFGKKGTSFFKESINGSKNCVFVALDNDKIVGYLAGGETKGEEYRKLPKIAELDNMFILKKYREHGIGTRLYDSFIKWCKKRKVKIMKVEATAQNEQAINFYRKNKFKDYTLVLERKL